MTTSPCSEENGLKKGSWTPEEDKKLMDYIQKHGHGKWRTLPKNAGLKRCGKSCRLRWTNYLRPDIKRGRFSFEEEETIIQLHSVLGNKWSTIAASLPGRTDNEIKNYWNTHIKKRLLKMGIDPVTHTPCLDVLQLSSFLNSSFHNSSLLNHPALFGMGSVVNPSQLPSLLTALLSCQGKNSDVTNQNSLQKQLVSSPLIQNQPPQCSQSLQLINSIQAFQPNLQPRVPDIQENHQSCATSNPLHIDQYTQLMKTKLEHQISGSATHFSHQNTLPNLWQYNGARSSDQQYTQSSAIQSFPSPNSNSIVNNILENEILHNKGGMPNFNLGSLLSSTTSTSSNPSPLNSSSSPTVVNGTSITEDARDTYCSNTLIYNISNMA